MDTEFDPVAAKARCEAATDLTMWAITAREDGFCVGNGRGHHVAPHIRNQADAELFAHARSDLLAAFEALEEAQRKLEAIRKEAHDGMAGEYAWYCRDKIDALLGESE